MLKLKNPRLSFSDKLAIIKNNLFASETRERRMKMDDTRLRALIAAVQCGSFSKAAEQLDYSQSGLTHMMDKLEIELGCELLERNYKGVKLSQQGQELLPLIQQVIDSSNALYSAAAELNTRIPQELHIGAFPSISRTFLPPIINAFRKAYPTINVDVTVKGRDITESISTGEIQLGFMDSICAGGLDWVPLASTPLVAIFPLDYPDTATAVELEDVFKSTFLSSPEQYIEYAFADEMCGRRMLVDASDDATIISMVASGIGCAIISELSLRGFEHSVKKVKLKKPIECSLGIGLKSLKYANPAAKTFISFVKRIGIQ